MRSRLLATSVHVGWTCWLKGASRLEPKFQISQDVTLKEQIEISFV